MTFTAKFTIPKPWDTQSSLSFVFFRFALRSLRDCQKLKTSMVAKSKAYETENNLAIPIAIGSKDFSFLEMTDFIEKSF